MRYFINPDFTLSECTVDFPANPLRLQIVNIDSLPGPIEYCKYINNALVVDQNWKEMLAQKIQKDAANYVSAVATSYLNKIAADYGYDNITSAVSYADEPAVEKFQTEGLAFRKWRSLVWEAVSSFDLNIIVTARNTNSLTEDTVISHLPAFYI